MRGSEILDVLGSECRVIAQEKGGSPRIASISLEDGMIPQELKTDERFHTSSLEGKL